MVGIHLSRLVALLLIACLPGLVVPLKAAEDVIELRGGCTLHDAIIAANTDAESGACPAGLGADRIRLTGDLSLSAALPPVTSSIAIDGEGQALDGSDNASLFQVVGGTLTLNDLTLTRCYSKVAGAALRVEAGVASVNASTIRDCRAQDYGEAIYIGASGAATIRDSLIEGWQGANDGLILNEGRLRIERTQLTGYIAKSPLYSGSVIVNDGGAVLISGSSISANSAAMGSAIQSWFGEVTLVDSVFADHTSETFGGAIKTHATTLTIIRSVFRGNASGSSGGAIFLGSGRLTLRDSLLQGNSSEWSGGAVAIEDNPLVTISGSILKDNSAGGAGGAIYVYNAIKPKRDTAIKIVDTIISGNRAERGGAIHTHGSKARASIDIAGSVISGNQASYRGGALNVSHVDVSIVDSVIVNNTAVKLASVIYAEESAIALWNTSLDLSQVLLNDASLALE